MSRETVQSENSKIPTDIPRLPRHYQSRSPGQKLTSNHRGDCDGKLCRFHCPQALLARLTVRCPPSVSRLFGLPGRFLTRPWPKPTACLDRTGRPGSQVADTAEYLAADRSCSCSLSKRPQPRLPSGAPSRHFTTHQECVVPTGDTFVIRPQRRRRHLSSMSAGASVRVFSSCVSKESGIMPAALRPTAVLLAFRHGPPSRCDDLEN